jgi:hypothetical protein
MAQGVFLALLAVARPAVFTTRGRPLRHTFKNAYMSFIIATLALAVSASCSSSAQQQPKQAGGTLDTTTRQAAAAPAAESARTPLTAEERRFYRDMAREAWTYFETNYQKTTGLVNATPDWANTTLWDVGGQILATISAKELGFLAQPDYQTRITKVLGTLERAELFRNAGFNKLYATKDGSLGSEGRLGWSATDLGRLFVALKILSQRDPQFAAQAERIVRRNNFKEMVKDGYMYGQLIGSNGKPWSFQEGRIGYEQYSAAGFAQWGADVGNALNVKKNAQPVKVMGVTLLQDRRYQDRLLSEPFILQGIELGLNGDMRELAANVLKAQQARYDSTGKITMASEDAVSVAPHYFYYYCVYCNGKPFVIDLATPGKEQDNPRWVSTKAAYGWHALMPSPYTKKATDFIAAAHDAKRGWASGVYEKTGASTNTWDINTAAVLLEIAYYQLRGGKPLIEAGPVANE